jgi:hypothetical protein
MLLPQPVRGVGGSLASRVVVVVRRRGGPSRASPLGCSKKRSWSAAESASLYNLEGWGAPYVATTDRFDGHVVVRPLGGSGDGGDGDGCGGGGPEVDLFTVATEVGLALFVALFCTSKHPVQLMTGSAVHASNLPPPGSDDPYAAVRARLGSCGPVVIRFPDVACRQVGLALFTTSCCSQNKVQLMTASVGHVTSLTPGSECNPTARPRSCSRCSMRRRARGVTGVISRASSRSSAATTEACCCRSSRTARMTGSGSKPGARWGCTS